MAIIWKPPFSYSCAWANLASQMRVAFSRIDRNAVSRFAGDFEMRRKTSEAAVSRSSASSRSRRRRWDSLSARTVGALRRFGVAAFRRRDLTDAEPALERRRIAHPKGLGLRRFSRRYYSRDFRPAKWVSKTILRSSNSKSGGSFYDDSFAHGFFARFFNSANVRPARRPSLVAVESSSSAWSERPASNAMNQRRKRAS